MIVRLELDNFTLFKRFSIDFSPKINIIIGENGTGKTHLLKATYAMCVSSKVYQSNSNAGDGELSATLTHNLTQLFLPLDEKLGKLHHHGATENAILKAILPLDTKLEVSFHNNSRNVAIKENTGYATYSAEPVFVPTKEVLSFMKGFTSLYERYELGFDKTYQDICLSLDLPPVREGMLQAKAKWAMEEIEKICRGKFIFYGGGKVTFKTDRNEYSANVMAEGFRKLGVLSRLIETGTIQPGISGALFWDEPEASLNPKLMTILVEILLELSRNGQQIILATHYYVLLKCFQQQMNTGKADAIKIHSLYLDEERNEVKISSTEDFDGIHPNPIDDAFSFLIDKEIEISMGGLGR
jgi:AAA15 family ATPase/GTPase